MSALAGKVVRRLKRIAAWVRAVKVRWLAPDQVDVVIFYSTTAEYLLPLCGGAKTLVIDVESRSTLQLSWGLLKDFISLLLQGHRPQIAYFSALLRRLAPAIVVTYIDNSELFYEVARVNHRRMRFLAIQNGSRIDVVEKSTKDAKRIFIPEFACFGEYERDLYLTKGASVGHFIPMGSLRESYFRQHWQKKPESMHVGGYDYDMCIVAEAAPGWNQMYPGSEDAIGNIAKYAVRLAHEKGLKLVIAGKRDVSPEQVRALIHQRDTEVNWYKKYVGDHPVTPRVRDQFTTYGLTMRSRLSLALMSTVLREASSRGSRVLHCNFSGDSRWDFCVDGIWSLKEDSYEAFSERVMALLALSDEAWREKSAKMAAYVMNNDDSNPTYVALQKIIADAVAARA